MSWRWDGWRVREFLLRLKPPAFWLPNKIQKHCNYAFRQISCRREFNGKWQEMLLPKDTGKHQPFSENCLWDVCFTHQGNCNMLSWQLWMIGIDPPRNFVSYLYCFCIQQSTGTPDSCSATHKHCGFLVTPELLCVSVRCFFEVLLGFSEASGTKHRKSRSFYIYTSE